MDIETNHPQGCCCGCQRAEEFLAQPVAAYSVSRRAFLQRALVGSLAVSALPLLESEAAADMFMPSVADQKKLGNQAAAQILQKYRVVKGERGSHFSNIGQKLVNALSSKERGPWDYTFRVIDSKEINAFALPGGNMFMFTGLLDRLKTDDEIAAVTGHEMTHVRKEHWAHAYAAQQKRELAGGLLLNLFHAGGIVRALAGGIESLWTLRYSRDEEDQADAGGLQNMVAAGYDPHGMLDLFQVLQNATKGGGGGPEFLSDHPLTSERIKRTQDRIAKLNGGSG